MFWAPRPAIGISEFLTSRPKNGFIASAAGSQSACSGQFRVCLVQNSLNQIQQRKHQMTFAETSRTRERHIFLGDFNMKRSDLGLLGLALKAGAVVIALVLST